MDNKYIAKFEVHQLTQIEKKISSEKLSSQNNLDSAQSQQYAISVNQPNEQLQHEDNRQNNGIRFDLNQPQINQNYFSRPEQLNSNILDVSGSNNPNKLQSEFDENDDNEDSDAFSQISTRSDTFQKEMGDDSNYKNIRGSSGDNSDFNGQSGRRKKSLIESNSIFIELNQVFYEAKVLNVDEVDLQQSYNIYGELVEGQNFNSTIAISFLNQYYQDQFNSMSQNGSGYMNANCNRIIKIFKDDISKDQERIRISLAKILQSLEGGYEDLIQYFTVKTFVRYTTVVGDQKISFYVIEFEIGFNTLFNVLRLLKDKQINTSLMQNIFQGIVDILLQMHARFEVANQLGLHSIYMHSTNIYLVDFFEQSISFESNAVTNLQYIPQGDLLVSVKDQVDYFKKDIYNLAKCLISIEMLKEGYSFYHIAELYQKDNNKDGSIPQFNFLLYANKHNCNSYFLKTKKFIAIEEGQIVLYEVQNIIEEMLQEDPSKRMSSVKLAMICQKANLLLRDVIYPYMNEFPPTFQLDQENNKKILSYPFKPIYQTQDIENHATIYRNDEKIFEGHVDILKKPIEICQVQIFQFYKFQGYFIQGFPYLKSQLSFQNSLIMEDDCYNFIFKKWLIKSKVLEEISKWFRGKMQNVELPNIILAGGNKKILKLNASYVMDGQIFESVNQIVQCIEFLNLNNIDPKIIGSKLSLEKLQNVRYLVISLDTEEKAKFLIQYFNSEYCSKLEVLDLSNSTKLDYKDYELNKTLNVITGSFTQLNTIILNNCKSSAPYQFLSILMNYENFKRINTLYIDETFVDQNIFAKMFDTPYVSSIKNFSLDDTSGINDFSVVQLSERLSKFKNMVKLNISGMLKKNFNKNLFTDSNISALKKLTSSMHYLIQLETLVLDDSYVNDSVLEYLAKSNMPSLLKIYLRKQQKVTYKGISYLLQTQNFRNLKLINCNSSPSITLPKNVPTIVEISVLNCKTINSQNISEYIRSNPSITGIRIDVKQIASDVITAINLSKYMRKVTLFCSEVSEISRIILLFKNLDHTKKIQFCIHFHLSKSYIMECDYEFLGPNQYKRNKPNSGTCQQIIDEFRIELKKAIDSRTVNDKIIEYLSIHRQSYIQFYNEQNWLEQVDISSFISLALTSKDDKDNFIQVASNNGSESNIDGDISPQKKKELQNQNPSQILPTQNQLKPIDTIQVNSAQDLQENHLNSELKKKFLVANTTLQKIQYLEDLQNFLNNPKLTKSTNSFNLSSFSIGPDEINLITFSVNLSQIEHLILQNSNVRSQDLKLLSLKSLSLNNLMNIDLSNNKLSIINGLVSLLKSESLPKLTSIKLGQYKIKILLKNITQSFRRVSVPLTLISHFPKFNTENKIKIMVQNNSNNKKYLETLDFYVKKGDFINEGVQFGHLKILMNPFISFYIRNCQKYSEQTHNLHRLMRFWRIKELSNQPFGKSYGYEKKDEQYKIKEKAHITLSVMGHELAGKRTIVENFLQNNFNEGQELQEIKQHHNKQQSGSLSQINLGLRYYHTEFMNEQSKINMTLKIMHSNPLFNQLRLNHLRDSDGICIIYDTSRKDIGPEMMQYLYEVHLFKYQKPVYVVANNFKSKKSANIFDHQNLIPDIKYIDVSISNQSSIKNFFSQITKDAMITKMKKPVFTNHLLNELSEELAHLHMHEFEMKLDFLKVRNKVDIETLKQFCTTQKENEHIIKMDLDIFNWGNFGKSTQELLNKIGEQKINIKVKNSISAYINN